MSKAREASYKVKDAGIDRRVLRSYRRSLDWKQSRNEVVNKRRNIQDASRMMSPLAEKTHIHHEITKASAAQPGSTNNNVSDARRQMLLKWKQEKDLKKKLDSNEQAKKKQFRVIHVVPELVPFAKEFTKLAKVTVPTVAKPVSSTLSTKVPLKPLNQVSAVPARQLRSSNKDVVLAAAVVKLKDADVGKKTLRSNTDTGKSNVATKLEVPAKSAALATKAAAMTTSRRPASQLPSSEPLKAVGQAADKRSTRSQTAVIKSNSQTVIKSSSNSSLPDRKTDSRSSKLANAKSVADPSDRRKQPVHNEQKKPAAVARGQKCALEVVARSTILPSTSGFHGVGNWSVKESETPAVSLPTPTKRLRMSLSSRLAEAEVPDLKKNRENRRSLKSTPRVVNNDDGSVSQAHGSLMPESDDHADAVFIEEQPPKSGVKKSATRKSARSRQSSANVARHSIVGEAQTLQVENTNVVQAPAAMDSTSASGDDRPSVEDRNTPDIEVGSDKQIAQATPADIEPMITNSPENTSNAGPIDPDHNDEKAADDSPKVSTSETTHSTQPSAEKLPIESLLSADQFATPGRSLRSRSITPMVSGSTRKTPRNFRNSLILRRMSPEEGVEILKQSPMIEMRRRRSVRIDSGEEGSNMAPMPNFDDVEDILKGSLSSVVLSVPPSTETINVSTPDAITETASDAARPEMTVTADDRSSRKPDVPYFRNLLVSEAQRLTILCDSWRCILDETPELSEEVRGSVRTTVGQAELLMAQRFKQFSGLVDNCEFGTGEKEVTCTDLQGFWDMVYFQVEDVDRKFSDLSKLKAADWVVDKPSPVKRKVIKKKAAPVVADQKSSGAPAARPNFAAFRRQMKQQLKTVEEPQMETETASEPTAATGTPVKQSSGVEQNIPAGGTDDEKVFDGGFFKVCSPVRQSPASTGKSAGLNVSAYESPLLNAVLRRSIRKSMNLAQQHSNTTDTSCATQLSFTPTAGTTTDKSDDSEVPLPVETIFTPDQPSSAECISFAESDSAENQVSRRAPLRSILHNSESKSVVQQETVVPSEQLPVTGKKMNRKSVCFFNDSTPVVSGSALKESSFLKYIEPTELSISENCSFDGCKTPLGQCATPVVMTPSSAPDGTTGRLVDISNEDEDEDDDTMPQFGHLRVGFTPGVDGRSRRISGFSPPRSNGTPLNIMSTLDEENVNLMAFSPSGGSQSSKVRRSSTRKSTAIRRSRRVSTKVAFGSE